MTLIVLLGSLKMDRRGARRNFQPIEEFAPPRKILESGHHLLPFFVLFSARGSKKASLLPSQVRAYTLCSGQPSYLHASRKKLLQSFASGRS